MTVVVRSRSFTPEVLGTLAVLVLVAGYMAHRAIAAGDGWSSFVICGPLACDPAEVPDELLVTHEDVGYDGRFFYRLSLDPFTSLQTDYGITLDQPAYRQQRILTPLLAFLLHGLTGVSTLIWLPVLSLAGCALATLAAASLLRQSGANPWWAVTVGAAPGMLIGSRLDTAEPLAIGLALSGLALVGRRPWLASLLLSAAVLARETTLSLAAGVGVIVLIDMVRGRQVRVHLPRLAAAIIPLLVFVAWQGWLTINWQTSTAPDVMGRIGTPVVELLRSFLVVDIWTDAPAVGEFLWWLLRLGIAVVLIVGIISLRSSTATSETKAALPFALAVVVVLPAFITPWQAGRASIEAYVLGLLVIAGSARYQSVSSVSLPLIVIVLLSA